MKHFVLYFLSVSMMITFSIFLTLSLAAQNQKTAPQVNTEQSVEQSVHVDSQTEAPEDVEVPETEEKETFLQKIANDIGKFFTSLDGVVSYQTTALTLLFLVLGYLSSHFPWVKKIEQTDRRVLTISVVAASAIFAVQFGTIGLTWTGVGGVMVAYVLATLGYDKILSPLGLKTPKPTA